MYINPSLIVLGKVELLLQLRSSLWMPRLDSIIIDSPSFGLQSIQVFLKVSPHVARDPRLDNAHEQVITRPVRWPVAVARAMLDITIAIGAFPQAVGEVVDETQRLLAGEVHELLDVREESRHSGAKIVRRDTALFPAVLAIAEAFVFFLHTAKGLCKEFHGACRPRYEEELVLAG